MKTKLIVSWLVILLFAGTLPGQESTRKIIQIELDRENPAAIKQFYQLGIDVGQIDRVNNAVTALVSDEDIRKITSLGLKSQVIIGDADGFARQLRASGYLENFRTYDQMVQEMHDIAAAHPDIVKLEDIGDSYEKTVGKGGYDIWAMKISDNVHIEEDEPEVFYFANIHAREIITPEIIMYFINYLVDNYGVDPYVTYLVNNRQIWLCPSGNPDGHAYVFTGADCNNPYDPLYWRKNKRDNNQNGIFETGSYGYGPDGVDLNRNFGYMWGNDNGSSGDNNRPTYRGTAPFSEPESQAIRDFVIKHNFIISLSFHSYSQLWLYPWGHTNILTPDNYIFVALAESCVAYNDYKPGTGYSLYPVSGCTDDWLYGERTEKNKIYAFTPEVGSSSEAVPGCWGFYPDPIFIEKQILENQGPMLYLAYAAGEEPIIEHTPLKDTESLGPYSLTAKIKPPIVLTELVPLDTASVKLFYTATGAAPFDSVFLQPTGNDEYFAEIPGMPLAETIYYCISASDQSGKTGWLPRGAPMATFSFAVGEDNIKPSIAHTPITLGSIYATAYVINALVTDNIAIATVKLFYRKNGGQLDSLEMTKTSHTDEYQGIIIPSDPKAGDYYEYQIVAYDNSRNKNQAQLPETDFFKFFLKNSLFYDFELEASFTPITAGDWEWGTPTSGPKSSRSGSRLWATNLSGNYNDMTASILETPEISLAGKDSAKLVFWHWYLIEYSDGIFWDGGNVKISVNRGPFNVIEPVNGYDGIVDPFNTFLANEPCFGGPPSNGNFWRQEVFDLTPYAGNSIKIRFHFASDQAVTEPGWYIDDVEIMFEELTAVAENNPAADAPVTFVLVQNYPNPFNPETRIQYHLARPGEVTLEIYNLLGKKVMSLINQKQAAGIHSVTWDGKDEFSNEVASGVYFYRLMVKGDGFDHSFTKKMVKLQ